MWAFSILVQNIIIVPVIHKLNQLERDRKANLKMLNNLGEGLICVDEGLEAEEELIGTIKRGQKKNNKDLVNNKASILSSHFKKKFYEEIKTEKENSKRDLLKEDEIIHTNKKRENIISSESNSIINIKRNVNNDSCSENLILEKNISDRDIKNLKDENLN